MAERLLDGPNLEGQVSPILIGLSCALETGHSHPFCTATDVSRSFEHYPLNFFTGGAFVHAAGPVQSGTAR